MVRSRVLTPAVASHLAPRVVHRATKWDLMRTVAVDNLEKKRQPMWADAIETVRRIQDEDLMKLALGGGYAPPGPVMFVSKVAAVLAGSRPAWLQFQNIISEKVRGR